MLPSRNIAARVDPIPIEITAAYGEAISNIKQQLELLLTCVPSLYGVEQKYNTATRRIAEKIHELEQIEKSCPSVKVAQQVNLFGILKMLIDKNFLHGFKVLSDKGFDLRVVDRQGNNFLHYAAQNDSKMYLQLVSEASLTNKVVQMVNKKNQLPAQVRATKIKSLTALQATLFCKRLTIHLADQPNESCEKYTLKAST
jgi:hypothetical protein